jgi:ubiquitin C-terminal hydrolase
MPVMAAPNGQYAYPMYAASPYQNGVQMVQGAQAGVPAYYFPYGHPAYAAHYQQSYGYQQQAVPTVDTTAATNKSSSPSASIGAASSSAHESSAGSSSAPAVESEPPSPPPPPEQLPIPSRTSSMVSESMSAARTSTLVRTSSVEAMDPLPIARKVSKSFSADKSKFRLNRSGSRPSLAIDGTGGDDNEDWNLPASPMMGRKGSLSVSPRHCGSEFLPDREDETLKRKVMKPFTKSDIHLVDAVRMFAKELQMPIDSKFAERLEKLVNAANIKMSVFPTESALGDVVGLENPMNSKICYLNSVVQILLPIAPIAQVLSLSLSHGSAGPWTTALARAMRLFFRPQMGVSPSLLSIGGMDSLINELGGIGTQQDVAEALGIVLNRLHEEWKHTICMQPWKSSSKPTGGLDEDSIIYKLLRGVRRVGRHLELFTQLHLAPPSGSGNSLTDLLAQSFVAELHYLPPVLCIELSRHLSENQLTTSQTAVSFSGTMRIPDSCCTTECNGRVYELVGAVVRSGVYANSGHFWAAQRRGNKWYWINDTDVSVCDVSEADQSDMTNGSISKKLDAASSWCVLVYADPSAQVAIHPYN